MRSLALAGGGVSASIAETVGARYLDDDPVTAASRVAGSKDAGFPRA